MGDTETTTGQPDIPSVQATLRSQRRARRIRFWVGFIVIAVAGSLWAGLSKDPVGPNFFFGAVPAGLEVLR
jgi:hypothetical protein